MSDAAAEASAFLIVRLGALGDIVHTIPAAAALRAAYPAARIDWLVDARHREIVHLVTCVDRVIVVESPTIGGWIRATRELRYSKYSAALDFQGLMKSAILARASGAAKVLGFSIWHLREKSARPFYSESVEVAAGAGGDRHVIHKNLRLLRGSRHHRAVGHVSAAACSIRGAGRDCRAGGGRTVRGHQPWRGVAEQAVGRGAFR